MFIPNICNKDLCIRKIDSEQDKSFDYIYKVYTEAFPIEERRERAQFIEEMQNPNAAVSVISYKGEDVGLFVYWDLDKFIYGGHLAIDALYRGQKIGDKLLKEFLIQLPKPMILEVEKPTTEIAKRRIAFYQRLGIHLSDNETYSQPAYRQDEEPTPLSLMEAPAYTKDFEKGAVLLLNTCYDEVKNAIYSIVYKGCKY